jgi:hypothetical protein
VKAPAEAFRRGAGVAGELVPAAREQLLEAIDVTFTGVDVQPVRASVRFEPAVAPEHLAQGRHLVVEHLVGGRRRILAPELLHEPVARNELVGPQDQQCQQGALSPRSDRKHPAAIAGDLERAK